MILGNVKLPLVRKNQPTAIYESSDSGIDKFIAYIFGPEHVVPTTFSRPNIAL